MRQLQSQYEQALAAVETEVDIAVRELTTSYQEIAARKRALVAAEAEAETIEVRWQRMIDGSGQSGLNLESLLRAQERVTNAEREHVTSVLTYNLAMINLRKANGTLLIAENVSIARTGHNCAGDDLIVSKGQPANAMQGVTMQSYPSESQVYEGNSVIEDTSGFTIENPPISSGAVEGSFAPVNSFNATNDAAAPAVSTSGFTISPQPMPVDSGSDGGKYLIENVQSTTSE